MTDLIEISTGYKISGTLLHADSLAVAQAGRAKIDRWTAGSLQIDFSDVKALDSSALAVLLNWARYARSLGRELVLVALPDRLQALIRVSGLDGILPVNND